MKFEVEFAFVCLRITQQIREAAGGGDRVAPYVCRSLTSHKVTFVGIILRYLISYVRTAQCAPALFDVIPFNHVYVKVPMYRYAGKDKG